MQVARSATPVAASDLHVWWGNTIGEAPPNPAPGDGLVQLSGAGSIYIVSTSRSSDGFEIVDDSITLLVEPNSRLGWPWR